MTRARWFAPGLTVLAIGTALALPDSPIAALMFGWLRVVRRIGPRIELNLAGLATGLLCVALLGVLTHFLGAWFYREIRARHAHPDWPPAWQWRWTVGTLGAVVMMFVAGLVGVGLFRTTSWLLEM